MYLDVRDKVKIATRASIASLVEHPLSQRDWCSPDTRCCGRARQRQCHRAGPHMRVSMHVGRLGEGVQGKTLPGRLELPTLRVTASRSNQLS